LFFFTSCVYYRDIHSFPTRRSSDLQGNWWWCRIIAFNYRNSLKGCQNFGNLFLFCIFERKKMKNIVFLFFIVFSFTGFAQQLFQYKTNQQQTFNLRVGMHKTFHYVKMDKQDIVKNDLFEIDEKTQKLVIPENGFYEISASFNFNPSTSVIKFNRGGVNFGIV